MGFVIWSPSGRLPRCARNDIKYFVRNKIHSLKSQNFDAIKPHKYKSILWEPRDVSFGVLKILVYRRTTSLLKSHYQSDNAHSFACVRLFPTCTQYPAGSPFLTIFRVPEKTQKVAKFCRFLLRKGAEQQPSPLFTYSVVSTTRLVCDCAVFRR